VMQLRTTRIEKLASNRYQVVFIEPTGYEHWVLEVVQEGDEEWATLRYDGWLASEWRTKRQPVDIGETAICCMRTVRGKLEIPEEILAHCPQPHPWRVIEKVG